METYGNANLLFANGGQYISFDGNEASAALDIRTIAVELVSTTDCWVIVGDQGATPTAAKPGAESTSGPSFPLRAGVEKVVAVPIGKAGGQIKIAVIKDTSAGVLYITERRE